MNKENSEMEAKENKYESNRYPKNCKKNCISDL